MKDLDWLREEVVKISENWTENPRGDFAKGLDRAVGHTVKLIDEVNFEPLSPDWVDEHSYNVHLLGTPDVETVAIPRDDLQNLLVPEPELPVIPKFVAVWYESEGKRRSWWNWFYKWGRDESRSELEAKTIKWMQDYNEEAFVNMFLHGYTVEEEQKYYVLDTEDIPMLVKSYGAVNRANTHLSIHEKGRNTEHYRLTEQEIKDYDSRYLAFKVPVEELEE